MSLVKFAQMRREMGDLYHFANVVLGYSAMAEQPHRLMTESVVKGGKRQLHLWPRGHFKSSCITVAYTIYRIAQNPNTRILIANCTLSNAKSFLREIKGHLEYNDNLRQIIGNHVNKDDKWTETEIVSKMRSKNLKEPTIQVAGVGQALASQHYDLIIGDDLVGVESVTTAEQIEKTKSWYKLALSLLEPEGTVILIGTRYNYGDLYGWLIENFKEEYEVQIHKAIVDGIPLFPTRFTKEYLDKLKQEQGSFIFSSQYLNEPVDDETSKFKIENFRYYKEDEISRLQLYTTLTIDRAYSLAKTADYTAFVIRSVDMNNNWYIRYAKRLRAHEGDIINMIFDLKMYYRIDKVGIEQKAFVDTIKPVLDEEMRRRNIYFPVEELKGRASKIARIESLVPRYEAHSIYHLESECFDLEDELLRFPSATHDDIADALAYQNDMPGIPTGYQDDQVKMILQQKLSEDIIEYE